MINKTISKQFLARLEEIYARVRRVSPLKVYTPVMIPRRVKGRWITVTDPCDKDKR